MGIVSVIISLRNFYDERGEGVEPIFSVRIVMYLADVKNNFFSSHIPLDHFCK